MPSMIGVPGMILIVIVALLLFGPSKLPELGRAFGRTLNEFKKGAKELISEEDDDTNYSDSRTARKEVREEPAPRRLPE